jgi:hypothetical protein
VSSVTPAVVEMMTRRVVLTTSYLFGGVGGGGLVGLPRAWLRSSSIKYFKKLPDLFGSAAAMSACANGTWAPVFRTGCLSWAQRIARISAILDVLDGAMDPAHTSVKSWASEDLVGMGSQRRVGGCWGCEGAYLSDQEVLGISQRMCVGAVERHVLASIFR